MPYSVVVQYDASDKIFVANVPEIENCMAHGNTREEAMREIQVAIDLHLELMREEGMPIPEPILLAS